MTVTRTLFALVVAALIGGAMPGPAEAAQRFTGQTAQMKAGAYITGHLDAYPDDYSPGYLLIRYLTVYEGAFMSNVRFAPSLGHQVVVGKSISTDDDLEGGDCASFQVVVEHFTGETLDTLERGVMEAPILIERSDELYGRMCARSEQDFTVEIRRVQLNVAQNRKAFSIPFSFIGTGGGN